MNARSEALTAEDRFFDSLLRGDREALESVLGADFILIDVMTGSEIPGAVLVQLVGSRELVFESIERLEAHARLYGATAIITGRTRMTGHYNAQGFQVHSRYTHVYAQAPDGWRLVAAQGTPIATAAS